MYYSSIVIILSLMSVVLYSGEATNKNLQEQKIFKVSSAKKSEAEPGKTPGWHNDKALGDHLNGTGNNLLENGSFEKGENYLEDWAFTLHDGAEGTVEWDDSKAKERKRSLKISKTNDLGYINVFCTKDLSDLKFKNLSVSGFYYTESAWPHYCSGFFRISYENKLLFDSKAEGSGTEEFGLINSNGRLWQKRHFLTKNIPQKAKPMKLSVIATGHPHVIWWDDIYLEDRAIADARFKNEISKRNPEARKEEISEMELKRRMDTEKDHEAWLEKRDGICNLIVDGKVTVPAIYRSSDLALDDTGSSAQLLHKYGTNIRSISIDSGKDLWPGKDIYDASQAMKKVENVMKESPEMLFIVTLGVRPYEKFTEDYPGDIWLNEKYEKGSGHHIHIINWGNKVEKGHFFWASYFSENYQNGLYRAVDTFIEELKRKGYLKKIIGFHIVGGHDGQFALRLMDYSQPAVKAFRNYLKVKYGTVENVSAAWNKDIKSFDEIQAPEFPPAGLFYDREKDKAFVDFHRFEKEEIFLLQDRLAGHLKKIAAKKVLSIHYCMEPLGGLQHGAHYLDLFLQSKNMDILAAQQEYANRLPGTPFRFHLPLALFNEYNKMMISEIDVRTFVTGAGMYRGNIFDPGFRSRTESFASWQATVRRMIGEMIEYNQGYWFYEIASGIFNDEKIAEDIGNINKAYSEIMKKPASGVAEAAVIYDIDSFFWTQLPGKRWHGLMTFNSYNQLFALSYSGVPFDVLTMKGLQENPKLIEKYKMFLFLNAFYVDERKLAFINQHLKRNGNYLIWLYGGGNLSGNSEKTTGFKTEYDAKNLDQSMIPDIGKSPLAGRMLSQPSQIFTLSYSLTLGYSYEKYRDQYFTPPKWSASNAEKDEILAYYKDTGKIAVAIRKMENWTSVFIGEAAGLDPLLFNALAKECKAFTASAPGLIINMNSRFISIHAIKGGRYTVNLQGKARKVTNMADGSITAKDSSSFELDASAQATYWFIID